MVDIEYRCCVRAALQLEAPHVEVLINSHGTPSPVLAASWLRAQVDWCLGQLGDRGSSAKQLRTWLDNNTAQWALFATLAAGEGAELLVCQGMSTVELSARRVITATALATP